MDADRTNLSGGGATSSIAGRAKWFALGVVAASGVGGAAWTVATRAPRGPADLPPSVAVLPAREIPPAPIHLDGSGADRAAVRTELVQAVDAAQTPEKSREGVLSEADLRMLDRPMIVSRSRVGPHVLEGDGGRANETAVEQIGRPGAITRRIGETAVPVPIPVLQIAPSEPQDNKGTPTNAMGAGKVINVNRATAAELELLPDVGPALAAKIINHRTKHGAFATLEDLDKVRGIGPKTLEKFKGRVVFGDSPKPKAK